MKAALRVIDRAVLAVWGLAATLALVVVLSPLEVTAPALRTALFALALGGLPYAAGAAASRALWGRWQDRLWATGWAAVALAVLLAPLGLSLTFWLASEPWQTTRVLYRHRDDGRWVIAHQMKGVGSFGYRRRVVRAYEATPFLRWDAAVLDGEVPASWDGPKAEGPGPSWVWVWVGEDRNPFGWQGG